MPTVYEKSYGSVKFYETDGTPIFDTEDDLGLWTSVDEEPSPEPKWVRVSVPGADGAVDLSRALAGQVTYERREIALQFVGKCASHAAALALVHQMRRALHGARVRMETVLTSQVGGYYVADCECDGVALTSGEVTVDVTATADPFIRIGNQTLALPSTSTDATSGSVAKVTTGYDPSAAIYEVALDGAAGSHACPIDADVVRLWWAMGENLFDASAWPHVGASTGYTYSWPTLDGQKVRFITISTTGTTHIQFKASDRTGTWPSWPYSLPFTGTAGSTAHLVAYVTGAVTAVGSSPHVKVTLVEDGTGTDADGLVQGTTTSASLTPTVGAVSQTLTVTPVGGVVSAIDVEVENTACTLTVGLALVMGTAPAAWEEARLGSADMFLPAPIGQYEGTSDMLTVYPYGAEVMYVVTHADGTSTGTHAATYEDATVGGMPPADATYVSASVMCDGGTSGQTTMVGTMPAHGTATGSNTTMRSIPRVTSFRGITVTIDGRTASVGPGTVDLPALTIPGGSFTVDYVPVGGFDATLTWEGGAL